MILDCLEKVLHRESMTAEESSCVMQEILSGQASPTQAAALLVALSMKGETEEELLGMLRVFRDEASVAGRFGPVEIGLALAPGSAAPFVIAGAGVRALQQAPRALAGEPHASAVLEALGIRMCVPVERVTQAVAEVGLGFISEAAGDVMERRGAVFAAIPVPSALDNMVPLLNPGSASAMIMEVRSAASVGTVARVVARMGLRRSFVFHGATVAEVEQGKVRVHQIRPEEFGLGAGEPKEAAAADAGGIAQRIRSLLEGGQGAQRKAVLLDAALGIVCGGKASNLAEGVQLASESIESARALGVLKRLAEFTSPPSC